ncbi:hypothetical protein MNAN1_002890 [Malassezia nana]|uniref:Uncharacterized protein n=1 Tax=Malassezia nana TaxID=180528 RepID=A0AAF0EK76_9BASI|nr:hypothetical protein MNAN1_002890 [Malassezia nana]
MPLRGSGATRDGVPSTRAPSLRRSHLESRRTTGDIDLLLGRTSRAPAPPGPFLPPDTPIVLSEQGTASSAESSDERILAILSLLSDPEKARRCAETERIETPDFQSADEPAMRGKTRGTSAPVVRASAHMQEDTSDEAYEMLHSKFERAEKRLRRLEKEGLVRDRRRMVEQVARLESMDVHKLLPALEARETELSGSTARSRDAILACALDMQQELLAETRETLARYNKLLPDDALAYNQGTKRRRLRSGEVNTASPPPSARKDAKHDEKSAPAARRDGPSLAALAQVPARGSAKSSGSHAHPPRSARTRATSAFGERLPDYVARPAAFDDTMAQWLEADAHNSPTAPPSCAP